MRVANGTRNEHASVLRLIRDNLADFEECGRVAFETRPFDTAGGVQRREVVRRSSAADPTTPFIN